MRTGDGTTDGAKSFIWASGGATGVASRLEVRVMAKMRIVRVAAVITAVMAMNVMIRFPRVVICNSTFLRPKMHFVPYHPEASPFSFPFSLFSFAFFQNIFLPQIGKKEGVRLR